MKTKILSLLLATAALTLGGHALADDTNVYEASEEDDAWLHGRCAFLGTLVTKDDHVRLLDGEIMILVAPMGNDARLVKRFACKEKPVFYKESFVPAVCEKLPEKDKARCEAKFPPPPPPPVVAPPVEPPPPVSEPQLKKPNKLKKPAAQAKVAAVRSAGF